MSDLGGFLRWGITGSSWSRSLIPFSSLTPRKVGLQYGPVRWKKIRLNRPARILPVRCTASLGVEPTDGIGPWRLTTKGYGATFQVIREGSGPIAITGLSTGSGQTQDDVGCVNLL